MSDDAIEEIRRRKLEELRTRAAGEPSAPSEPIPVESRSDLDDVVGSHDVVLVDFYADWCGPCRLLKPTVDRIAQETEAAVATVDIDASQQLAAAYGVRSVPTLILFVRGEPTERLQGVQDEATLTSLIDRHASA